MASALGDTSRFSVAFSGGFGPATCSADEGTEHLIGVPRCSPPPSVDSAAYERLQRLAPRLRSEADGDAPDARRARAIWKLLWSDELEAAEVAVQELEDAAAAEPSRLDLLGDLAGAYLLRAERGQDPRDLVAALEVAERARGQGGASPELRLNLAIARCRLHLSPRSEEEPCPPSERATAPPEGHAEGAAAAESIAAFRAGLREDHEERLTRFAETFPAEAREAGFAELLVGWAEAVLGNDTARATEALARARRLGEAIAERSGDRILAAAAAEADAARSVARRELAQGLLALASGRQAIDRFAVEAARSAYREAVTHLRRAGSLAALAVARLGCAAAERYAGDDEAARDLLRSLLGTSAAFPVIEARALLQVGDLERRRGDLLAAERSFREALARLATLQQLDAAGATAGLLDELLDSLGEPRAAWEMRLRALSLLASRPRSDSRLMTLIGASRAAQAAGQNRAALVFQQEALDLLGAAEDPTSRIPVLLNRARSLASLGEPAEALRELSLATREIERIESPSMRERAEGEVILARARVLDLLGRGMEERELDHALALFVARHLPEHEAALWQHRGRARRRAGDARGAAADFEKAYRRVRGSLRERLATAPGTEVWEAQRRILEDLALLEVESLGRPERALAWLEEGTATGTSSSALAPAERATDWTARVRRRLQPGEVCVRYGVLGDTLLIWVITPTQSEMTRQPWPRRERELEGEQFARALESRGAGSRRERFGQALRHRLLDPVRALAPTARSWWIVPDVGIESLPFAALPFDDSGRPAIEQIQMVFYDSLTALTELTEQDAETASARSRAAWRALVVGEPAIALAGASPLPALPLATIEARSVAARFPPHRLLLGSAATRAAFLDGLGASDLVHFAGHAIPAVRGGGSAGLLLAPSAHGLESDVLRIDDLLGGTRTPPRLVVLAACGTAREGRGAGRRSLSLLQAFARWRVPAALGTLWEIDDEASRPIVESFYDHLLAGESAADALRAAQLQSLREAPSDSPPTWAAFRLLGDLPAPASVN